MARCSSTSAMTGRSTPRRDNRGMRLFRKTPVVPEGICQCGCGKPTHQATRSRNGYTKGEPLRFLHGHIGRLNAIAVYESKLGTRADGRLTKRCTACGNHRLLLEEFNKSATRREHRRAHCKVCERKQARICYRQNPEPYKRRARLFNQERSRWRMAEADRIRSEMGCLLCGERTVAVLDFHHLVGNSKGRQGGVPVTRAAGNSDAQFRAELARCVVLCANCHRKLHHGLVAPPKHYQNLSAHYRPFLKSP